MQGLEVTKKRFSRHKRYGLDAACRRAKKKTHTAYDALALRGFLLCLNLFLFRANTYRSSLSLAIGRRGDFGMARAVLLSYYYFRLTHAKQAFWHCEMRFYYFTILQFPPGTCHASLFVPLWAAGRFGMLTRHIPQLPHAYACYCHCGKKSWHRETTFWHVDATFRHRKTQFALVF